ncbi:MAG: hypothetical protein M3Y77_21020 [Actinomycetota bacterium]|nr:hypothetical protein [Actinomycetota bacterium]
MISGTSAFIYVLFYLLLVLALTRSWNWIQLPSVIYSTMIISLAGIPIFGVEFFGPVGQRTPNPAVFLAYNLPYIVFPLLLLQDAQAAAVHPTVLTAELSAA